MNVKENKKRTLSDKTKIGAVFFILFLAAVLSDFTQQRKLQDGELTREALGGEEQEVSLNLEVEGLIEEKNYVIDLPPIQPTEEEALAYIDCAIETMEQEFQQIDETVPLRSTYENGMVEAEWLFSPYGLIDAEGNIQAEKLSEKGTTINAQVELSCGNYERIYTFAFVLIPKRLTEKETVLQQLQEEIQKQINKEGSGILTLPAQVKGHKVIWSENRELLTPQILILEVVVWVLMIVLRKKKQKEEEEKRLAKLEREYPDMVNQLSLLLGAGMTTRQAWNRMGAQYKYKRQAGMIEEKEVYEAILRMSRRFSEGESERIIYQDFSQEIPGICYRKLMRLLLGNLEKGTCGITNRLEEECRHAYEQRLQQAKKLGEEASTKMLLPLMIMLSLVMGVVMLPALIEFQL